MPRHTLCAPVTGEVIDAVMRAILDTRDFVGDVASWQGRQRRKAVAELTDEVGKLRQRAAVAEQRLKLIEAEFRQMKKG